VKDNIGSLEVDAVTDVALDEPRRRVDLLAFAEREIVDNAHLIATRKESIDEIRADEPGASCDNSVHGPRITTKLVA
jgi:hypothetical protein